MSTGQKEQNERHTMKKLIKAGLGTVLALGAIVAIAQDAGGRRGPGGFGGGQRPQPAIITALDANKDGKLDATEIANAATALKTLDKNGDGEITADEMFGPRPEGGRPPGGGPGRSGPQDPPSQ
jgi:hypothetical protein